MTKPVSRKRSRGFSVLELMVALTAGGIAISSIYAVGAASGRIFQEQQRVASTQSALRMAMDQVKRDIARAGYLSTPNAGLPDQVCAPISGTLHNPALQSNFAGIARYIDNVAITGPNNNTGIDPTGNNAVNGFTADEIVLIANYASNSEYSGITAFDNDTIALQQNWQAFRRDFFNWHQGQAAATIWPPLLNDVFLAGRAVRVQTATRKRFFSTIAGYTLGGGTNDLQINLNDSFGPCQAEVAGGQIAPLGTLRYWVQNATGPEAERFAGTTGPMAQLLRTEVDPTDAKDTALIGAPQRVVLDYVAAFNLDFSMTTATGLGNPDNYLVGSWNATAADVNQTPERMRAVRITLAARTPMPDPRFLWTQAGCANLRCFQVFVDQPTAVAPAAARVRWLQTEVFLPNIAFEGY